MTSEISNLTVLANSYIQCKKAADMTATGKLLKIGKNAIKESFFEFCKNNRGWNRELAKDRFPDSILRKMDKWSHLWNYKSNQLTMDFPPLISENVVQYCNICKQIKQEDQETIDAAKKAHRLFRACVLQALSTQGYEKVRDRLGGNEIHPRIGKLLKQWYDHTLDL